MYYKASWLNLTLYFFTLFINAFTHPANIFLVLAQMLWIWFCFKERKEIMRKFLKVGIIIFIGIIGLIILIFHQEFGKFYIKALNMFTYGIGEREGIGIGAKVNPRVLDVVKILFYYHGTLRGGWNKVGGLILYGIPFVTVLVSIIFPSVRQSVKIKEKLLLLWLSIPIFSGFVLFPLVGFPFTPKYFMCCLPAYLLLVAYGAVIFFKYRRYSGSVLGLMILVSIWQLIPLYREYNTRRWDLAAEYISKYERPGDIIVMDEGQRQFKFYYKGCSKLLVWEQLEKRLELIKPLQIWLVGGYRTGWIEKVKSIIIRYGYRTSEEKEFVSYNLQGDPTLKILILKCEKV